MIAPIGAIEARYPGGLTAYRDACPNDSYLPDEHLTRVGLMSTAEAARYMGQVAAGGAVMRRGAEGIDRPARRGVPDPPAREFRGNRQDRPLEA